MWKRSFYGIDPTWMTLFGSVMFCWYNLCRASSFYWLRFCYTRIWKFPLRIKWMVVLRVGSHSSVGQLRLTKCIPVLRSARKISPAPACYKLLIGAHYWPLTLLGSERIALISSLCSPSFRVDCTLSAEANPKASRKLITAKKKIQESSVAESLAEDWRSGSGQHWLSVEICV